MTAAAKAGNTELVEFFVSMGADDWNTGLNADAKAGSLELTEYFMDRQSIYRAVVEALEAAVANGNVDIVKYLIKFVDYDELISAISFAYNPVTEKLMLQAAEQLSQI